MNDRTLLERAARAAGNGAVFMSSDPFGLRHMRLPSGISWDPLTDDGDALRLAVRLNLLHTYYMDSPVWLLEFDATDPDPYAATRRAVVRAAAALGEP